MTGSCRVPTPAERAYHAALLKAEAEALEKVIAALKQAQQAAATAFSTSELDGTPPPDEYFASVMHQKMYCILCKADLQTFAGGDPAMAIHVIRNSQNIAKH